MGPRAKCRLPEATQKLKWLKICSLHHYITIKSKNNWNLIANLKFFQFFQILKFLVSAKLHFYIAFYLWRIVAGADNMAIISFTGQIIQKSLYFKFSPLNFFCSLVDLRQIHNLKLQVVDFNRMKSTFAKSASNFIHKNRILWRFFDENLFFKRFLFFKFNLPDLQIPLSNS